MTTAAHPLTTVQKAVLRVWGICWHCKKGRHLAKDCPSKVQRLPPPPQP
jgi:hypothetical protein